MDDADRLDQLEPARVDPVDGEPERQHPRVGAERGQPSLGWLVGWVEAGIQQTVFAMNMDCKDPAQIAARMNVVQQCLTDIVAI